MGWATGDGKVLGVTEGLIKVGRQNAQNKDFTEVRLLWALPGSGYALEVDIKSGSNTQCVIESHLAEV